MTLKTLSQMLQPDEPPLHTVTMKAAEISPRQGKILDLLRGGLVWTDRQVTAALGFDERNAVQPRITELIKAGLVAEVGKTKCNITGKRVRVVAWRKP